MKQLHETETRPVAHDKALRKSQHRWKPSLWLTFKTFQVNSIILHSAICLHCLRWDYTATVVLWPPELIAAVGDNAGGSTSPATACFQTDVDRSHVKLHRADQARQEVRHRSSIERLVHFQNKTPSADSTEYFFSSVIGRLLKVFLTGYAFCSMG